MIVMIVMESLKCDLNHLFFGFALMILQLGFNLSKNRWGETLTSNLLNLGVRNAGLSRLTSSKAAVVA